MRRCLNGSPKINSKHGQKTSLGYYGRHLGYDYGVPVGVPFYAPEAGKITSVGTSKSVGRFVIMDSAKYTHRFFHLSKQHVAVGKTVKEGMLLGKTGNTGFTTGPHMHHDTRKKGTAWNASFSNYVDWEKLLKAPKPVYLLVAPGKGLADLARRAGYKDWFLPTAWQRISNLNRGGKWTSYNKRLKPGERVRVR